VGKKSFFFSIANAEIASLSSITTISCYAPPEVKEHNIKRCFCPSVHPSITYIANNSRTQRPSMPKFGRKVPHLSCDSHSSSKVKMSKVKVIRPINAHTHHVPYLPNSNSYELGTRMEDDDPHQSHVP